MKTALIHMLEHEALNLHAIEIVKDDRILLHYCPDGDIRYPVYSITKSITSAAFSIACDDGLLSSEAPLSDLLETDCRYRMVQEFKSMPFFRFLTMTAGKYPFRPQGDNWLSFILSLDTDYSDAAYHYSNIPAYLVGRAVENAVSVDLMKFLDKRLFLPLGIERPPYRTCPEGHFYGATGIELTVHELALLGQLYLNKGSCNGSRLISEASVSKAVTPYVITPSGDSYGYFFRIAENHYSMAGKWGQRCMIYPENGLVIAYMSDQPDRSDDLYKMIRKFANDIISGSIPQ